jgi:hypothetical protein
MVELTTNTHCLPPITANEAPDLQYILKGLYVDLSFPICLSFESGQKDTGSRIKESWLHTLHQLVRKSSLQNPMNQESWGFIYSQDRISARRWSRRIEGNDQVINLLLPPGGAQGEQDLALHVHAEVPLFPWNLGPLIPGMIFIGALLLIVSFPLLRYVLVQIFPMPLFPHGRRDEMPRQGINESLQNILIVGPPGSGKSALARTFEDEWERFDLHSVRGKTSWAEISLAQMAMQKRAVVVDHFEYQWDNPAQNEEKRLLIEGLLSRDLKVCIMTSSNPYDWDNRPSKESLPSSSLGPQGSWTDLFHTFGLVYFIPDKTEAVIREWLNPQTGAGYAGDKKDQFLFLKRWLERETNPTVHLKKIGNWMRAFPDWPTWSPEEMKEQIRLTAFPYYRSLWESCSIHEKLALFHVATDGFLHTHNPELVTLSQKGLLRFDPDLQLLNESFRSFVMETARNSRIAGWEEGATSDTWARLKYPFLLVFGVIVIFLFATQQEFKNSFITLLSLLPILLPALPELPLLLTGQKNTGSSSA